MNESPKLYLILLPTLILITLVLGHLDSVRMTTAEKEGAGPKADWVEECFGANYIGVHTDVCAPGYTRDPPNGGKYAPCVKCNCNGHSDICDPETG